MSKSKMLRLTALGVGIGIILSAAAVKLGATENHLLMAGLVLAFIL